MNGHQYIVMPDDKSTAWTLLWKLNQIAVPALLAWGVCVTPWQYEDKAHRESPHAVEPVEKDVMHRIQLDLKEIAVRQADMAVDLGDLKRGLLNR